MWTASPEGPVKTTFTAQNLNAATEYGGRLVGVYSDDSHTGGGMTQILGRAHAASGL